MKVLVINSGSSSLKYQLFEMASRTPIARGLLERIGEPASKSIHNARGADGQWSSVVKNERLRDHREAIREVSVFLGESEAVDLPNRFDAIGHRVVHGGEQFREPAHIDQHVLESIRRQSPLAPLHNPAGLAGIEATMAEHPEIPQVAVFDTAFHQTIPRHAFRYALPEHLYREYGIRRYGFHGTSFEYVAKRAADRLGRSRDSLHMIALHLGNGASAAAIRGGKCIDTSMGLTPLEGLMMGTRCGDIDPAVLFHLNRQAGMTMSELESLLNKESGLKGVCGDNDMREVLRRAAEGDPHAQLAVEIYCYRIKKYVGAYAAALGKLDAIVFTAGIGEHAAEIRERCCAGLELFGIAIDPQQNAVAAAQEREIQAAESQVKILVIPTNEELEIAIQTVRCINASK